MRFKVGGSIFTLASKIWIHLHLLIIIAAIHIPNARNYFNSSFLQAIYIWTLLFEKAKVEGLFPKVPNFWNPLWERGFSLSSPE